MAPQETGEVRFRVFIDNQTSDESEHSDDSPRISKVLGARVNWTNNYKHWGPIEWNLQFSTLTFHYPKVDVSNCIPKIVGNLHGNNEMVVYRRVAEGCWRHIHDSPAHSLFPWRFYRRPPTSLDVSFCLVIIHYNDGSNPQNMIHGIMRHPNSSCFNRQTAPQQLIKVHLNTTCEQNMNHLVSLTPPA